MNLNILWALIMYYGLISIFYVSATNDGVNVTGSIVNTEQFNTSAITEQEASDVGLGTSVSTIFRFLAFMLLGIGLPTDTPQFIVITFAFWQIMLNIFTAGFIYQALRGS